MKLRVNSLLLSCKVRALVGIELTATSNTENSACSINYFVSFQMVMVGLDQTSRSRAYTGYRFRLD